jgi:tetratricopeptide (TPR) repeat protein
MLASGGRTALPRQQTMRAAIDWSYDLLSAGEQRLFARLSVFAGGWTLQTATAVCADEGVAEVEVFEMLSSLVDKSLVVADDDRFQLLESTRAYALEKLTAAGERETFARRHAEYFRDRALAADESYGAGSTFAWVAQAELELGNNRAALEWALMQGNDATIGGAMAGALGLFWHRSSLRAEGRYWCELALESLTEAEQPRLAANLWLALARLSIGQTQVDAAERAVRLFDSASDPRRVAQAQRQLVWALLDTGSEAKAKDVISTALATARRCGDASNVAYCLYTQAWAKLDLGDAGHTGDADEARSLCAQAVATLEARGDEIGLAIALGILGEIEFAAGDPERALRVAIDAREIQLRGKDVRNITQLCSNIAAYSMSLEDYRGARASAEEGLRWARRGGLTIDVAIALQHLALLSALDGMTRRAARVLGYVDAQFAAHAYRRGPTSRWGYSKLASALAATLSAEERAALFAEGAAWSEDRAMREALSDGRE